MRRSKLLIGGLGLLGCGAILIVVFPGVLLGAMLIFGSQRTVYERVKSPDGWHEARVQFDDGGAISGFSRLVFVKHGWNLSDEPLLSCRAFWGDGEAKVHLVWLNSSTLLIQHHFARKDVKAAATRCGPIIIHTEAVQPLEATE